MEQRYCFYNENIKQKPYYEKNYKIVEINYNHSIHQRFKGSFSGRLLIFASKFCFSGTFEGKDQASVVVEC